MAKEKDTKTEHVAGGHFGCIVIRCLADIGYPSN